MISFSCINNQTHCVCLTNLVLRLIWFSDLFYFYICSLLSDVEAAIINLTNKLPELRCYFDIHNKIGEGTFSSVYLASLKNTNNEKKFAIKHLIPTCHPKRIKYELECLQRIGYVNVFISFGISYSLNDVNVNSLHTLPCDGFVKNWIEESILFLHFKKMVMSNVIYNHFSNNKRTKVCGLFLDIQKAFNTNINKWFLDKMEKIVK